MKKRTANVTKVMLTIITVCTLSVGISSLFASANLAESKAAPAGNVELESGGKLLKGEVGDKIELDGLIFERLPDDAEYDKDISSQKSEAHWSIISFSGFRSLTEDISLTKEYGYWNIWIKNTGSARIVFTITNSYYIPAGETWNIYTASAWSAGTYEAGFTSGSGIQGEAHCRIAAAFTELDIGVFQVMTKSNSIRFGFLPTIGKKTNAKFDSVNLI